MCDLFRAFCFHCQLNYEENLFIFSSAGCPEVSILIELTVLYLVFIHDSSISLSCWGLMAGTKDLFFFFFFIFDTKVQMILIGHLMD